MPPESILLLEPSPSPSPSPSPTEITNDTVGVFDSIIEDNELVLNFVNSFYKNITYKE